PETLEVLVDGVKLPTADDKKMKFLRRIPKDPFTNSFEWGKRSMKDDPKSLNWSGDHVFDVYSKTLERAADGTPYSEWYKARKTRRVHAHRADDRPGHRHRTGVDRRAALSEVDPARQGKRTQE